MKIYFHLLIRFLSLLIFAKSLYIYVDPGERDCLSDYRMANSSFDVVYYVSGQEEELNEATIEDTNGNIFFKVSNINNAKLTHKPNVNGMLNFCFTNLASNRITLSFEFDYGTNDYSMISIKTIEHFVHVVNNLEKKLKKLQFNIRNSAVRKKAHFNIAN